MNCINKETWNYKQNKHQNTIEFLTLFIDTDVWVCVLSVGGNQSTRGKTHLSDLMTCQIALNIIK